MKPKEKVARPERFELATLWFEARCSIQLSYGREATSLPFLATRVYVRNFSERNDESKISAQRGEEREGAFLPPRAPASAATGARDKTFRGPDATPASAAIFPSSSRARRQTAPASKAPESG